MGIGVDEKPIAGGSCGCWRPQRWQGHTAVQTDRDARAVMRYDDWGQRSPRWAGIRSRTTYVRGVPVHYLSADPAADAPAAAPTHMLMSTMIGSASNWLDLIPPLTGLGPVIAVDPPGTLAGHTASPTRRGPRAQTNARFLRAFARTLDLHDLVVHGWSMGGLVTVLFADLAPERVTGLVLTAPTLPWRFATTMEALAWHSVGRVAILMGVPVARMLLRLFGGRMIDVKRAAALDVDAFVGGRLDLAGGDPTRLSPELWAVWADESAHAHPERLPGAVTAVASAMWAMFVDQRPTRDVLDRLDVPVLLLWGDADPLIDPPTLEGHARRPQWEANTIAGAGHLLPVELPDAYTTAVADWLPRRRRGPDACPSTDQQRPT
jgi:pimeloyl-ACP methyl ester carboxylesterase